MNASKQLLPDQITQATKRDEIDEIELIHNVAKDCKKNICVILSENERGFIEEGGALDN